MGVFYTPAGRWCNPLVGHNVPHIFPLSFSDGYIEVEERQAAFLWWLKMRYSMLFQLCHLDKPLKWLFLFFLPGWHHCESCSHKKVAWPNLPIVILIVLMKGLRHSSIIIHKEERVAAHLTSTCHPRVVLGSASVSSVCCHDDNVAGKRAATQACQFNDWI